MFFEVFRTPESEFRGPVVGEGVLERVWKYMRFFSPSVLVALSIPFFIMGGAWIAYYALAYAILIIGGDLFFGEDKKDYSGAYKYLGIFPYIELVSIVINATAVILFAWMLGLPETDLFGIAALVQSLSGFDAAAAHANNTWGAYAGGFGMAAIGGAINGVIIGHNTTHRTFEPKSVIMGRIGQAFGMFTYFSIRHPYGHHNLIGTPADPSWARRGENFYVFRMRSVYGQYKMTWDLEKERLNRMGMPVWHWRNEALQGWAMELVVLAVFFYAAGWLGVAAMLAVGFVCHTGLELANYCEHQGLVREPSEPFQPRHAWDDAHRLTYWFVCGISRHSHHHSDAQVEEFELKYYGDTDQAMSTPYGYFVSFLVFLIPPLWNRIMIPRWLEWDANYATAGEKRLAALENLQSGLPELVAAGEEYFAQEDDKKTGKSKKENQPNLQQSA